MVRVDKETLFYPLNTNTEKIKVLFIFLKPPSSKVPIKRSLPTYIQGYISDTPKSGIRSETGTE